jgi:hypothetical protein
MKDGGWLDKYEQGGLVLKQKTHDNYGKKPNANYPEVTLPPGFVGQGYNIKGRNYSPAWGGQFQNGGWLEKYADDAQNGDEVTYTHNPSGSREAYMLKRTVTPYTSKRDIRKKTQTPTDPRQVNFLSNYAGAIGEPGSEGFVYPTSVPFEGKKHWNIDRFIIDPQFGTSYPELRNQASTREEMRNNVLADMYKYNMLQNPDKRGKAWRQSKKFVRTEIDPRTSGAYYEEAVRSKLPFAAGSITDAIDESYMRGFGVAQSSAQSPDVSDDDYYTRDFKNKPITESRAKEVATDWLRNYKGLSKKQAKQYIQSLPTYKKLGAFESGGILQPPMAGADQTVPMYAMGGSLPGAVGFTYARVSGAAPANGPYAKKTKASAQNGQEMSFYQHGLDWKPKNISRNGNWLDKFEEGGEIIKDNEGYWNPENWGKPVEIGSNEITMEGVLEPLLGVSDTGDTQMMYPGKNYTFSGTKVVEYPREYFQELGVAKDGKSVNRADEYPLEKLDNLLNFTNYNKPQKAKSGKWLDKYQ